MLSNYLQGQVSSSSLYILYAQLDTDTSDRSTKKEGSVRLVGGSGPHEGRVEVSINGRWSTVCNSWDSTLSEVVCQQLGYSIAVTAFEAAAIFGEGIGFVWDIRCYGWNRNVTQCLRNIFESQRSSCSHSRDVGLICSSKLGILCVCYQKFVNSTIMQIVNTVANHTIPDGTIQLEGGSGPHEGQVLVYFHGHWGSVNKRYWSLSDAIVVCTQLGYPTAASASASYKHGSCGGLQFIWLDNVLCSGFETNLTQCSSKRIARVESCSSQQYAAVTCSSEILIIAAKLNI